MTRVTSWAHLSEVPEPIRATLSLAEQPYREEDARLEAATLATLRQVRLRCRVPALVDALQSDGLDLGAAFMAVSLHLGISFGWVKRLHYERRKP